MKAIITLVALGWSAAAYAQIAGDSVFITVEQMPEYPGGEQALMRFLSSIKYPAEAKEKAIAGTAYVKFIIEKDGSVSNVEAIAGDSLPAGMRKDNRHEILDKAAVAHVKSMPKWKPGYWEGEPARVQYIVPIRFVLK